MYIFYNIYGFLLVADCQCGPIYSIHIAHRIHSMHYACVCVTINTNNSNTAPAATAYKSVDRIKLLLLASVRLKAYDRNRLRSPSFIHFSA